MQFDLDARTASLGVGDFADFTLGPRDGGDGAQGLWRAQLGTHWHQELRKQTASEQPGAEFEVVIAGPIFHRGWTLTLSGRIDQLIRTDAAVILREIKTHRDGARSFYLSDPDGVVIQMIYHPPIAAASR